MNFLNNISLRNKILLALTIPLVLVIFLSYLVLLDKIKKQDSIIKTKEYLQFTLISSKLALNLQKESEFCIDFVESYGKMSKDELHKNQEEVNKNIKEIKNIILKLDKSKYSKLFNEKIKQVSLQITEIKKIRNQVKNISISKDSIDKYYKNILNMLSLFIDDVLSYSNDGELSKKLQAYIALVNFQISAQEEKKIVKDIFTKGILTNSDSFSFNTLVSKEDIFLEQFKKVASKKQIKYILNENNDCLECKKVIKFRKILFNKSFKDKIISDIFQNAGFGGLIHNYKNYLIRANNDSLNKVQKYHTAIKRSINKYRRLKEITSEEKKLLKLIKNSFDTYMGNTLEISESFAEGKSINEIDEIVKQKSKNTILALRELNQNIFGVKTEDWIVSSSKRIKYYEDLINTISFDIQEYIDKKITQINTEFMLFALFLFSILIIAFFVSSLITNKIVKSLKIFKQGLEHFFQYVIRENDNLKPIDIKGDDEFAQMTQEMNKQIEKIEKIIEQDKKVVLEISDVMEKVSNGFFEHQIKLVSETSEIESLKQIINKMIRSTKSKVNNINRVLENYSMGKYNYRLTDEEKIGMDGDFGILSAGSVHLGQSISHLIAMITNAGEELKTNTIVLTDSSKILSKSSKKQANSLEETASSVEQITQNMKNSSSDVNKMLDIADELNQTAVNGNDLAKRTSLSMNEINEKVSAISNSILVIDQIAFQTNILSLNAAVEAATAGEAGKGFAVVAQEVRTLANRSAKAANEIKKLVEDANLKSKEGKEISNDMIDGYENLSLKIIDTKNIIDNVSSTIKEQEKGMIQINDAISQLDIMTQNNASTSITIDELSKEVANLSTSLLGITQKTKINDVY